MKIIKHAVLQLAIPIIFIGLIQAEIDTIKLSDTLGMHMTYDKESPTRGWVTVGETTVPYQLSQEPQLATKALKTYDNTYINFLEGDYDALSNAIETALAKNIVDQKTSPKLLNEIGLSISLVPGLDPASGTGELKIKVGEKYHSSGSVQPVYKSYHLAFANKQSTNPDYELFMHIPGAGTNPDKYLYIYQKDAKDITKLLQDLFLKKFYQQRPWTFGEKAGVAGAVAGGAAAIGTGFLAFLYMLATGMRR